MDIKNIKINRLDYQTKYSGRSLLRLSNQERFIYMVDSVSYSDDFVVLELSGAAEVYFNRFKEGLSEKTYPHKDFLQEIPVVEFDLVLSLDEFALVKDILYEGRILSNFEDKQYKYSAIFPNIGLYILNCSNFSDHYLIYFFNPSRWGIIGNAEGGGDQDGNVPVEQYGDNGARPEIEIGALGVGNGSTAYIHEKNNNVVRFIDFGGDGNYYRQIQQLLHQFLRDNIRVEILLTHWDSDHYNYLNRLSDDELEQINVIAPIQKNVKTNCIQLQEKLDRLGVLTYIHRQNTFLQRGRFVSFKRLNFFEDVSTKIRKEKNNSGLVFRLCYREMFRGFFPGDCLYRFIGDLGVEQFDFMYITHHGSANHSYPIPEPENLGMGISWTGQKYGFPRWEAVMSHSLLGWEVTNDLPIIIDLFVNGNFLLR